MTGPTLPISEFTHQLKHRQKNETFDEFTVRFANALKDSSEHFHAFRSITADQRFLAAGRVQTAVGAARVVTPYNCYVSGTVLDSMKDIMTKAGDAAETLRMGGGLGTDFSGLRPSGSHIASLDSSASGPVSFMGIWNAVCETIRAAGHRRGALMGTLRVDHPDIEEFIRAKQNNNALKNFNISVLVTDEFMDAVKAGSKFELKFGGKVYRTVDARALWDEIMRANWYHAEPGVLFIDRINEMNNLYYCEEISATNPCGEQPLPPYGACLLGSFNLTKYIIPRIVVDAVTDEGYGPEVQDGWEFNFDLLTNDIPHVVRAMDNVIDVATYPLPQQEHEAKQKRRMGLGITGLADTLAVLGIRYGTPQAQAWTSNLMRFVTNECYRASALLAEEKGAFPLFKKRLYLKSKFVRDRLDDDVIELIAKHGIRNSHLISIAPCGTISLTADNVTSSIEPAFSIEGSRIMDTPDGMLELDTSNWAWRNYGIKPPTFEEVTAQEHIGMLVAAQYYVDSAVSKTCNISDDVSWEEFKDIYMAAYDGGAKGCTTATERAMQSRGGGVLRKKKEEEVGAACFWNPETGERSCE